MIPAWMIHATREKNVSNENSATLTLSNPTSKPKKRKAKKERVLSTLGGGSTPVYGGMGKETAGPSTDDQIRISNNEAANAQTLQQLQRQYQQEDARATQEREAAALADRQNKAGVARTGFTTNAQNYGTSRTNELGLGEDDYGLGSAYNSEVQRLVGTANPDDPNSYAALDSSGAFDRALSSVTNKQRNKFTQEFDGQYGDGFERTRWQDTADDDILNGLIAEQQGTAKQGIDRAIARGTILDTGVDYANNQLGRQTKMANAKAQSIGGGVLSGYRNALTGAANTARSKIGGYDLGENLNVANLGSGIEDIYRGQQGSLEGDVLNAVGDQDFFSLDALLKRASGASGIVAPGAGVAPTTPTTVYDNERTLGNVGSA